MKQLITVLIVLVFACSQLQAFQNHRYPISPMLNYSALPAPTHTEVSAELSIINSGAFTYAFSQNAQQGIALSAPYFHVFSARETYFKFHDDPQDISDTLKALYTKNPEAIYARRYFMIGSAFSLANIGLASEEANAAFGFSYMSRRLTPESGGNDILEESLIPSIALKYQNFQGSLLYSHTYFVTAKFGYIGNTFQAGSKLTLYTDVNNSFEIGIAGEKRFYDAVTLKTQLRNKWQASEIYQQTFSVSALLRLRPYNVKNDPTWLKYLIDPLQLEGIPTGIKESMLSRFIYNIEIGVGVYSDIETKDTFTNMTLSKYF